MCHVSVGSANAICAIMNASRDQIPIIFMSGRTPLFESGRFGSRNGDIHWAQEMFDQAGMMREVVKWDYELRDGLNVEQVVDRAYGIAQAAPCGPIYLTLRAKCWPVNSTAPTCAPQCRPFPRRRSRAPSTLRRSHAGSRRRSFR